MSSNRRKLTSRPLDILYLIYFMVYIVVVLGVDVHLIYPPEYIPEPVKQFFTMHLQITADPLVAGMFGLNGPPALWAWFKGIVILELAFQVPVALIALRGLWKDSQTLYPLYLIFAASTATLTLPCTSTVLHTPLSTTPFPPSLLSPFSSPAASLREFYESGDVNASAGSNLSNLAGSVTLTKDQRAVLLVAYLPFMLIPVLMSLDMSVRVAGLISAGSRVKGREVNGKNE